MAIGTITLQVAKDAQTLAPRFKDHIRFAADSTYISATGMTDFAAAVASALGKEGVDIIGVSKAGPCGGYEPIYDKEDDALHLYQFPDALGPATALPDGDYNAVTLDLWVEYM